MTGAYYSPEEICLPFKIMMGNFLECIEREPIRYFLWAVVDPADLANTVSL